MEPVPDRLNRVLREPQREPASAGRPPTGDRERYQAQWVTARTMELLQGWERRPVDVADMVYAAATAYPWRFWHQI